MKSTDVLIIGAGPTGLVLALSLVKAGVVPRIIDKKPRPSQESRALGVQARTLEYYRQLGLAEDVVREGVQVREMCVRENGRVPAKINVNDFGQGVSPYPFILCYPQDAHEELLVQHLRAAGVEVEWETALLHMRDTGERVLATLLKKDGEEEQCAATYICGCDGARSIVRQNMKLNFTGGTSDKTYFVADVEATGEATSEAMTRGALSFCLTDQDFILVLPARNSGTHRLIGLIPETLNGHEGITFEDVRATAEAATGTRVHTVNWFSTYRVHHRVADHFRAGRAFVAGDAGHVHSPLGGQGMNTGIADAVNLAWKLGAVLGGRANAAILTTYEPERIAFARSLVATTDTLFLAVNGSEMRHRLVRRALFLRLIPLLLRFSRTRNIVYRRISQTLLNYRASALSHGAAGTLHGGDRLPWVALNDGSDNFLPLQAVDWQMHVYGNAGAAVQQTACRTGLALHQFDWSEHMERVGLKRDALYLVRPDGYIALVDAAQSVTALHALLTRFEIAPRTEKVADVPIGAA